MVRHKKNIQFVSIKENELPDSRCEPVLQAEIMQLTGLQSKNTYQGKLRRVALWDEANHQVIEVITNQMSWTANTINERYKARWKIEIFFREIIKQLLHIKSLIGTSQNAVMIQIWIALTTLLLLKMLKEMAKFNWYLSNLMVFIRFKLFTKIDLQLWIDTPCEEHYDPPPNSIEGVLF